MFSIIKKLQKLSGENDNIIKSKYANNFLFQMGCSKTCVDDFLNRTFYKLGYFVGKHPGYFVIIPILLGFICFTGYQRIQYQIDPEYLFTPVNGPGKIERAVVEQYFKVNYSHQFNVGRITRPGKIIFFFGLCVNNFRLKANIIHQ